jgi:hypothetical protein
METVGDAPLPPVGDRDFTLFCGESGGRSGAGKAGRGSVIWLLVLPGFEGPFAKSWYDFILLKLASPPCADFRRGPALSPEARLN